MLYCYYTIILSLCINTRVLYYAVLIIYACLLYIIIRWIYIYIYEYTYYTYTNRIFSIPNILYYTIYYTILYSSIKWAGRPDAAHDKSIPDRLQPRSSFALYVEHAAKTSNNFSNIDIGMYIILSMLYYTVLYSVLYYA